MLQCSGVTEGIPPLELAEGLPHPGEEIIVMGYPTGVRTLLARADKALVNEITRHDTPDFWLAPNSLAQAGYIKPLASRGIVGQVTSAAVVYDAQTTHGGSGGPVLTPDGKVVAVNSAMLAGYEGSNLGVPVSFGHDIIGQVNQ